MYNALFVSPAMRLEIRLAKCIGLQFGHFTMAIFSREGLNGWMINFGSNPFVSINPINLHMRDLRYPMERLIAS